MLCVTYIFKALISIKFDGWRKFRWKSKWEIQNILSMSHNSYKCLHSMQNIKSAFCFQTEQEESCTWHLSKLKANSWCLGKSREQFALEPSMDKLPKQVMANLFHLKCHLWLTVEIQSTVYGCTLKPNESFEECQAQFAMSAKDGRIYGESTDQPLVIHFQNHLASLGKKIHSSYLITRC